MKRTFRLYENWGWQSACEDSDISLCNVAFKFLWPTFRPYGRYFLEVSDHCIRGAIEAHATGFLLYFPEYRAHYRLLEPTGRALYRLFPAPGGLYFEQEKRLWISLYEERAQWLDT